MRNCILFFLIALPLISCSNDEAEINQGPCDFINFKYYNGSQDVLGEMSNDYVLIAVDSISLDHEIENLISTLSTFDQNYDYLIHKVVNYKFKEIPLN
ncbi:hypothetical protein [Gelidibacter maritimus]|uniref:Uncharacterized protein n=1 Tax=Gelidibacter maritimus TaxID=2761487 RepID=A0A7W2M6W6_9FLAO|nr:hypothetical protein [Gelidibacter maritimus]MBA6153814.1 hypothetical protein [Gelidibacter maritimus]